MTGRDGDAGIAHMQGSSVQDLPDEIAGSWQRCLRYGLDPGGAPEDAVLSQQDLQGAMDACEDLLLIVRPELELLSTQIAGTNYMTAFADADGVVLDTICDTEFGASACAGSIHVGSIWREDLRGTNALGLALHSGQTSIVTGQEHFFAEHRNVSCVSSPIFASDGQLVGLLDASSEVAERQKHTHALVSLAATNIENRLFVVTHRNDYVIRFHPRQEYLVTQSTGLLAFNEAGLMVGANRSAARLLAGAVLVRKTPFEELFDRPFPDALTDLSTGEMVQIRDWLKASYFAQLRPNHRPAARVIDESLVCRARSGSAAQRSAMVFDDDLVRESLRVAEAMMELGQPVCISGPSGAGKTAMAEVLHHRRRAGTPLHVLDCRNLVDDDNGNQKVRRLPAPLGSQGTLLLENVSALEGKCPAALARLLDNLVEPVEQGAWNLIATWRSDDAAAKTLRLGPFLFHHVCIPQLGQRIDFPKIARALLAEISTAHQFSSKGMAALTKLSFDENIRDLRRYLHVLVATCPAGVIRDVQVSQLFPKSDSKDDVCPRCAGNEIRAKKCREIRRMYRVCQGNVALTARRLDTSRNTVYLHLKD